ncbi:MAG: EMC3/TMCO1 family protein [Candidatus Bathyarchaeia archaeon]
MVLDFLTVIPASTFLILLVSISISLISGTLNRKFTNPEKMKEYRIKSSELRKQISEARKKGDRKAYARLMRQQKELLKESGGLMKQQYKVMFIPMIGYLGIFYALSALFSQGGAPAIVAYAPFPIPWFDGWATVGPDRLGITFYQWYILCAFAVNTPIYRLFKISIGQ